MSNECQSCATTWVWETDGVCCGRFMIVRLGL